MTTGKGRAQHAAVLDLLERAARNERSVLRPRIELNRGIVRDVSLVPLESLALTRRSMIRRAVVVAMAVVAVAGRANAQASPTVPPSAAVYRDLERMASLGLLDTMIVGVRPVSEREIVRLLNAAKLNVDRNPAARDWTEPTIREYLERFSDRRIRVIDSAMVETARLSSPVRLAPSDANGSIDADVNPLAAYRGGRTLVDGTTIALETAHSCAARTLRRHCREPACDHRLLRRRRLGVGRRHSDGERERVVR